MCECTDLVSACYKAEDIGRTTPKLENQVPPSNLSGHSLDLGGAHLRLEAAIARTFTKAVPLSESVTSFTTVETKLSPGGSCIHVSSWPCAGIE